MSESQRRTVLDQNAAAFSAGKANYGDAAAYDHVGYGGSTASGLMVAKAAPSAPAAPTPPVPTAPGAGSGAMPPSVMALDTAQAPAQSGQEITMLADPGQPAGGMLGDQSGMLRSLGRRMPTQDSMALASIGKGIY